MCTIRHQSRRLLNVIIRLDNETDYEPYLQQPEIKKLAIRDSLRVAQYLEGRDLITLSRTLDGTSFVSPTPKGRSFLVDEASEHWRIIWHDLLMPIAIAAITTLVTLWLTGYFTKETVSMSTVTPVAFNELVK